MKQFIKKNYRGLKKILNAKQQKAELIKFKKEIWQTDEISNSFIKGTDGNEVVAAQVMDKEVNEFFLSHCSKGDKVLDIGCGHGIVSVYLAENGMGVTAIDISEKLLNELKKNIEGKNLSIEIKKGDAYKIDAPANSFDVVVARMFLPHFPDWPKVLKEMTRVTKKNGKLLVHFSSKENTDLGKNIGLKDCRFASSPDVNDPWTFYAEADKEDISRVSKDLNIKLVSRTPVSFFLHNRIIGYQLGTAGYNEYMTEVQNFMKDEKVQEFMIWFDKQIIAKCSPALSHFNILNFKKL
jgi:ubiquinone/menaquinone biosynthesis C-methylase UbiE